MTSGLAIDEPLPQYQRELVVGMFLDLTGDQWRAWIHRVGDDAIPRDLHEHVVHFVQGLFEEVIGETSTRLERFQLYVQSLGLLADDSLVWLVEQVSGSTVPL